MMTEVDREMNLQDEDRLPWLEAVDDDDAEEGVSSRKLIGFVLAALLALALVVGGVSWLQGQKQDPTGDGSLIAAKEGDYKVKPENPGGMKVEGQGDAAFAASEGAEANGKMDTASQTEAPVTGVHAATASAAKTAAKPVVTAVVPPSGGALAPTVAPVAGSASGGSLIQLGAYGSELKANTAWTALTAANPSLAKLAKSVVPAAVNGSTVYRLRANAGTAVNANAICAQVGHCMVVK